MLRVNDEVKQNNSSSESPGRFLKSLSAGLPLRNINSIKDITTVNYINSNSEKSRSDSALLDLLNGNLLCGDLEKDTIKPNSHKSIGPDHTNGYLNLAAYVASNHIAADTGGIDLIALSQEELSKHVFYESKAHNDTDEEDEDESNMMTIAKAKFYQAKLNQDEYSPYTRSEKNLYEMSQLKVNYIIGHLLRTLGWGDDTKVTLNIPELRPILNVRTGVVKNVHVTLGDGTICDASSGAVVYDAVLKKTYSRFDFGNRPYYMSDNCIHYVEHGIWRFRRQPMKEFSGGSGIVRDSDEARRSVQKELDFQTKVNREKYAKLLGEIFSTERMKKVSMNKISTIYESMDHETNLQVTTPGIALHGLLSYCGIDPTQYSEIFDEGQKALTSVLKLIEERVDKKERKGK